jgi:hypothetical protein
MGRRAASSRSEPPAESVRSERKRNATRPRDQRRPREAGCKSGERLIPRAMLSDTRSGLQDLKRRVTALRGHL